MPFSRAIIASGCMPATALGESPAPLWSSLWAEGMREESRPRLALLTIVWGGWDGIRMHSSANPKSFSAPRGRDRYSCWNTFSPESRVNPPVESISGKKNRRNKSAGSLADARSAGICGGLKGHCSAHEIVSTTFFSRILLSF